MKKKFIDPQIRITKFDKASILTTSVAYVEELNEVETGRKMQIDFNDIPVQWTF